MSKLRVSLFGATGLLGSEIFNQVPEEIEIIPHTHQQVDITQEDQVFDALKNESPQVVINAVAYNDVDGSERNSSLAHLINEKGPAHLAKACASMDSILVHVSTDYVFPSRTLGFFSEEDAPAPLGAYGLSKWKGEEAVKKWKKNYVLRTSSLYGYTRTNHAQRVVEAIQNHKVIDVASDLFCSPTLSTDLAGWIYQIIKLKPSFGIYHACNKGLCSRFEFATLLCELLKASVPFPIKPLSINALNLPAQRPQRPALSIHKLEKVLGSVRSWEESLREFSGKMVLS